MPISKVDVLHASFKKGFFGYKRQEVDVFLQEIAERIGELAEEKENLESRVEDLEKSIAEYKSREGVLQSTLVTTQKMVDDVKANAHKQAKIIVEEAQNKAEGIINQAHKRLSELHEDIAELKRQRTQFEINLNSLLDSHKKLLEQTGREDQEIDEAESKLKFLTRAQSS
ncbi:MAG: DivIVA domain-containing protein [Desulfonatronovibrionaceae bacterium]